MNKLNGTLTFVATCLYVLAGSAAADELSYEMGAYTNAPGGSEIMNGDYAAAIAAATRLGVLDSETSLSAATNLCVAYTMTRSFDKAASACNRALTLAKAVESPIRRLKLTHEATSHALTNRGVLRAVRGDAIGATADFRAAASMSGTRSAPGRNLAYLRSLPADRVASVEPSAD